MGHPGNSPSSADLTSCETCRFWRFDQQDWEFDSVRMGECKGIKMREEIVQSVTMPDGIDRWDDEGERLIGEAMKLAKAIAVDGSGYYAALRTTPDFGCVLHEKADK